MADFNTVYSEYVNYCIVRTDYFLIYSPINTRYVRVKHIKAEYYKLPDDISWMLKNIKRITKLHGYSLTTGIDFINPIKNFSLNKQSIIFDINLLDWAEFMKEYRQHLYSLGNFTYYVNCNTQSPQYGYIMLLSENYLRTDLFVLHSSVKEFLADLTRWINMTPANSETLYGDEYPQINLGSDMQISEGLLHLFHESLGYRYLAKRSDTVTLREQIGSDVPTFRAILENKHLLLHSGLYTRLDNHVSEWLCYKHNILNSFSRFLLTPCLFFAVFFKHFNTQHIRDALKK